MKNKFFAVLFVSSLSIASLTLAQSGPLSLSKEPQEKQVKDSTFTAFGGARQEKISLDIKGMDILDVFKMFSSRSGMNIAVGKNVTGRVTLFLKDVDMWDAFEIVILANDLAYEEKGGIINVMAQRDYELVYGERYQDKKQAKIVQLKYAKAIELSKTLTQIKSNIGRIVVDEVSNTIVLMDIPEKLKEMENLIAKTDLPIQTKVFGLNYAQVDKISDKIKDVTTKGLGSVTVDERTNKIVVTDYPEKLDEISKIISAFDEKTPQVLIDAQIIEIRPSDKFEMGVDWDYWIKKNFRIAAALPVGTTNRLLLGAMNSPTVVGQHKAILDLLRTIGDTKILSSPRIMALNNQEARILVGDKDAYITSTTSLSGQTTVTSQSVNFVDVGIKLYVTPTINRDGFITMKIRPEISSSTRTDITSDGRITQIPIVSTSETETTVMIKDNVTIIIGGLKKNERQKTVKKIPIIGDIPLLGFFFRSTSDETKSTELVILLTPHIVSGENSYTDFNEIKPNDGAVARMVKGDIVMDKIQKKDIDGPKDAAISEYYKVITDKVRNVSLKGRPKSEKGEIRVGFILSKDGKLINEPYILETDNPILSQFVVKAIKKYGNFEPFPDFLKKDKEVFEISLSYE